MIIGFRSFPDGLAYVVLDGTQSTPKLLAKDRVSLPRDYSWPACLAWVRKQLEEILQVYDISGACIKTIEPVARKKSTERLQIEGVIQEHLFSTRGIECNTRIKSQLKRDIRDFTDAPRYLERVLIDIDELSELNTAQFQEATLAAVSELPED